MKDLVSKYMLMFGKHAGDIRSRPSNGNLEVSFFIFGSIFWVKIRFI